METQYERETREAGRRDEEHAALLEQLTSVREEAERHSQREARLQRRLDARDSDVAKLEERLRSELEQRKEAEITMNTRIAGLKEKRQLELNIIQEMLTNLGANTDFHNDLLGLMKAHVNQGLLTSLSAAASCRSSEALEAVADLRILVDSNWKEGFKSIDALTQAHKDLLKEWNLLRQLVERNPSHLSGDSAMLTKEQRALKDQFGSAILQNNSLVEFGQCWPGEEPTGSEQHQTPTPSVSTPQRNLFMGALTRYSNSRDNISAGCHSLTSDASFISADSEATVPEDAPAHKQDQDLQSASREYVYQVTVDREPSAQSQTEVIPAEGACNALPTPSGSGTNSKEKICTGLKALPDSSDFGGPRLSGSVSEQALSGGLQAPPASQLFGPFPDPYPLLVVVCILTAIAVFPIV